MVPAVTGLILSVVGVCLMDVDGMFGTAGAWLPVLQDSVAASLNRGISPDPDESLIAVQDLFR
jgi:hypothetical protein